MIQLERGLHGIEPVTVANFPMKKYSDEYFAAAEDTQYVPAFLLSYTSSVEINRIQSIKFNYHLPSLSKACVPSSLDDLQWQMYHSMEVIRL